MVDNRISFHLGKIECILFGTKSILRINSEMKVMCGETKVTAKTSVRYLGVDVDKSRDGQLIAEAILKKGYPCLKVFLGQATFLNQYSRRLLASSLIQLFILIRPALDGMVVCRTFISKNYKFYKIKQSD